ncbi:amino acid ABC transporter substrate-binding protein [Gloeothece verrucosa]|uniref:Extracellular solute-binding protein family 3 n=1 Tax=Gloeothece verrucosa (strain PCC 7822) TaxID=497965 RepID=E0UHZ8_GLOV7|nr:amino acid ABC transporter substrate-binding protein [Gloeothece verrucosa]ADN14528.1 extracellular solute-binding protein family 3 [Gloeothece verrucosa PCC 7822]
MPHPRYLLVAVILLVTSLTACGEGTNNAGNSNTQASPANGETSRLDTIKARGTLICGVNGEVPGFSFVDEKGQFEGLDVDMCRAVAAALFDDPNKVEFRKLTAEQRFTAVQSGEVDILNRNTTWTLSRDTSTGMEFGPTTFYDGQGMMVTKASGITKLEDLKGKSICVLSGTTTEQNLADQMRKRGVTAYTPVASDDVDQLYAAYQEGRCEGITSDRSQLVARRSVLPKPQDHIVLDVVMSKEPLGTLVADGDSKWFDTVKWITYAVIEGEELGINSKNIANFDKSQDPNVRRFLGLEGTLGQDMGLPNDFAARVIKHVGNYGEIYERNIGKPLGLERGPNRLWTNGGLLYSPPFR